MNRERIPVIHFRMVGQASNQAIQYCLARILADRTGLAYHAPPHFKTKAGKPVQWSIPGGPLFTMQSVPGRLSCADGIPQIVDALQWFDIDSLDPQRPVIVRRWFGQRYEILKPYRDRIRNEWLRIPPGRLVKTDLNAVYVHVRRGDYIEYAPGRMADPMYQGTATTVEEYAACLREFPGAKRLHIITDDVEDPFVLNLGDRLGLPWTCELMPWDWDFLYLASARWVILSQSTFSWLAAFLGSAEKIACPVFPGTFWGNGYGLQGPQIGPGGLDFPNLYVDDEPGRWVWVRE